MAVSLMTDGESRRFVCMCVAEPDAVVIHRLFTPRGYPVNRAVVAGRRVRLITGGV